MIAVARVWNWTWFVPVAITLVVACSGGPVRFTEGPAVVRIADDQDIPEPGEKDFSRYAHHFNNFVAKPARMGLDPLPPKPAEDVNRFGEVPNSSWVTHTGENELAGLD